ncbi:oligopeptide/dipeptide ABC transporter ATP-binding protein [Clostridium formicaceticum]|uniref:Dipeptide/oligopeptide/nickel ABC transporter ATP-binding protein n=1 Tax=Clostridium formicaceticum TaxID=1497 RepID=A0AAC9RNK1_9CLOT|nr:ABC transporter ATP-binding protein [Clostridium formicaceticum]AOY77640.1 dipeptide/oligopeptide/nickel ABC transporter ATP-binding protein [Clostridium formicaceticum]ARE88223.1 Oligopeptide transport ATP-binding protein OppF [Clostridium formicaceticum]
MIKAENLKKSFTTGIFRKRQIEVLKGVSFEIQAGETLGLVGESGCGKSTLAKIIVRLLPLSSGKIFFEGKDLTSLKTSEMQKTRSKMQLILQHPEAALNPRMKIYDCIVEPLRIHGLAEKGSKEERAIVEKLIEVVGLQPEHLTRYSKEISGGQAQRAVLARILSLEPKFIVADEPTSMLDVSVQAQILNLLKDIQKKFNMAYLFVSHDLEVVRWMSDRIAVMYKGNIIEIGRSEKVLENPIHPYTKSLVENIVNPLKAMKKSSKKEKTSPAFLDWKDDAACSYCISCPNVHQVCGSKPQLQEVETGHHVACWFG